MNVDGRPFRTIWVEDGAVRIIDQTLLPHTFEVRDVPNADAMAEAISVMRVRGAPLIGAAAAYGVALGLRDDPSDAGLRAVSDQLLATRPTAVNLRWALERVAAEVVGLAPGDRAEAAFESAGRIAEEDVRTNRAIGAHAHEIFRGLHAERPTTPLRILTHCNAGWLATVDHGTATAGIYGAHDAGLPVHVWVDETRPRGQGARLTAWELGQHGVPHTVVPDTAAAYLMSRGEVDVVIVGTDRTTASGDVVNKIGTLGVALAAQAHGVPFYVAAPGSSIDFRVDDGREVEIEERGAEEVAEVMGRTTDGRTETVRVIPEGSPVRNYAFDLTPARLVRELITERGVTEASREGLAALYPERAGD